MRLTSTAFKDNQMLPSRYTCDGLGIPPPLHIEDLPKDTKSLTIIVSDPDAPRGAFIHWIVWNIPITYDIQGDILPQEAIEGINSARQKGYFNPCPPSGTHRYVFTIYALDSWLDIDENSDNKALEKAMENHTLTQTKIIGLYKRKAA